MKSMRIVPLVLLALAVGTGGALAGETKKDPGIIVEKARLVLQEMMQSEDRSLPVDLIQRCSGLAIVPGMIKGGFVVAGAYGEGVVLAHRAGAWTSPAFIYAAAGSIGLQIGAQSIDLILVIVGEKALKAFARSEFKLGADVAIAAGPIGAQASAATDILLKGGIYSYSRSKGLFAGASLEGAKMGQLIKMNEAYYQRSVSPEEILEGKVAPPPSAKALIAELEKIR